MSKILIVPDVHGRKFWHKAKEMINEVDRVVFLGDYLDPYPYEKINFQNALDEFDEILEFKEKYPNKVILLVGNHDMHYIKLCFMDCSRLNTWMRVDIHDIFMNNIDKFQLIYPYDTYLFSHAGVYQEWLDSNNLTIDNLLDFKDFIKTHWRTLQDVSVYRGGWINVGSCVWADINESVNNKLHSNNRQIVGHTQLSEKPYITTKIACLDVRKCFILDTVTDEIMGIDA